MVPNTFGRPPFRPLAGAAFSPAKVRSRIRHSFAKNLLDAGTPLDQVAVLLGHKSLDTTKIYTRPSQQDLERAVRRAAGDLDERL